jgi:putative PIN family toxin of toxin-antitoxin system
MRVVADTNTIVSGLLWKGPPFQLLEAARTGQVELYTNLSLLTELTEVLQRDKFAAKVRQTNFTVAELVSRYAMLATLVTPTVPEPVISADPDDDVVLACAITAGASVIVSGDHHLLELRLYRTIPILTVRELLNQIA